jgi:hypothetical protein
MFPKNFLKHFQFVRAPLSEQAPGKPSVPPRARRIMGSADGTYNYIENNKKPFRI